MLLIPVQLWTLPNSSSVLPRRPKLAEFMGAAALVTVRAAAFAIGSRNLVISGD